MAGKRRSSDWIFNQAVKQACVSALHTDDCQGTAQDVATMQEQLQQWPQLLEYCRNDENSPLMTAAVRGHELCVKLLLENGANVDAYGKMDNNTIMNALCLLEWNESNKNVMKLLLEYGSYRNPNSTMTCTSNHNPINVIFYLIGTCNNTKHAIEYVELMSKHGLYPSTSVSPNASSVLLCLYYAWDMRDCKMIELLLKYGLKTKLATLELGTDAFCDYIIEDVMMDGNLKLLKCFLIYNQDLKIHSNIERHSNLSYAKLIFSKDLLIEVKIKILRLFHKFGYNLWFNAIIYETDNTDEADKFCSELKQLRSNPLSLKCLSRVAILHAMGREFPENSGKLEIPASLHSFLQFPDVEL